MVVQRSTTAVTTPEVLLGHAVDARNQLVDLGNRLHLCQLLLEDACYARSQVVTRPTAALFININTTMMVMMMR